MRVVLWPLAQISAVRSGLSECHHFLAHLGVWCQPQQGGSQVKSCWEEGMT